MLEIGANYISRFRRVVYTVISLFLITYGLHGVVVDDLVIPKKHGWSHLKGTHAWLVYSLWLCVSTYLLSKVFNYYDPRDNHETYVRVGYWSIFGGIAFFYMSLLYGV